MIVLILNRIHQMTLYLYKKLKTYVNVETSFAAPQKLYTLGNREKIAIYLAAE